MLCPIGKSIFTVNLPLNLFRATVANAETRSLKSLHTLFDTYLGHMLAKLELNRMVQKLQNCELLHLLFRMKEEKSIAFA